MNMKHYLLSLACLLCSLAAFSQRPKLQFCDGQFKIMQLTDLHWVEADDYQSFNDSTYHLIKTMIEAEKPDLVIITGDVMVGWNVKKGWEKLAALFAEKKLPFAVTMGNHDEESDMNNPQILSLLQTFPYQLTYDAEPGLSGSGNCALPIWSSDGKKEKWLLYLFDSHNNTVNRSYGYYNWIKQDQIAWYRRTGDSYASRLGTYLPSLAFFHIPLQEYNAAQWGCTEYGEKQESICCSNINSGLFAAFIEQKDVIGVFTGHDHNNDFLIDVDGNIALAYGRKTGYASAYHEVLERGVRIIQLHEEEAGFDTYVRDLKEKQAPYYFEQKNHGTDTPRFAGSFIQLGLVHNWDDARWDQEMNMLKEAGMKYLIYAPSLFTDTKGKSYSNYPSSLTAKRSQNNTLERCLRSAQKNGMKIFVGLNFNDRWWQADFDAEWLMNEMAKGNQVAQEIVNLYKAKYPDALYGWYWVWELDNKHCLTPELQYGLATALNINLDYLTTLTPEMPLLLSPYMNGDNFEECGNMWENIFRQTHFRAGDIFAPQDCVGAGGLTLDNVSQWFTQLKRAVKAKPGLKFWGNVETFDQRFWVSAPLDRVKKQMQIANGFVSNLICFAYSHYNSPYVKNSAYHKAYLHYCQSGQLPDLGIPQSVTEARITRRGQTISIQWSVMPEEGVDGIAIYRNGALIQKLQQRDGQMPTRFIDKEGKAGDRYEIATYNVVGTESSKTEAIETK